MDIGVIQRRLDELAVDIGRLRRRLENGREVWTDLDVWALERLGDHVQTLDVMLSPPAATLAAIMAPGSDEAVDAAIEQVEQRRTQLRRMLGSLDPLERLERFT